jgi:multicomponent Na+:H+ antiporter subunit G
MMIVELIISVLLITGALFILIASIGILRMPDIYMRMHAATKAPSLGIMLMLLGAMIYFPSAGLIIKSFLIIIFLYLTTPVAANLLARTSLEMGIPVWLKKDRNKNSSEENHKK